MRENKTRARNDSAHAFLHVAFVVGRTRLRQSCLASASARRDGLSSSNARASKLRARCGEQAEEKEEAAYSNEGNAVRAADGFHRLQCSSRSDPSSLEKLF
jgi:hypothetical protein